MNICLRLLEPDFKLFQPKCMAKNGKQEKKKVPQKRGGNQQQQRQQQQ